MQRFRWVSAIAGAMTFVLAAALFRGPYQAYAQEWLDAGPPVEHPDQIPYIPIVALLVLGGGLMCRAVGLLGLVPCSWFTTVAVLWIAVERASDVAAIDFLPDPSLVLAVVGVSTAGGLLVGKLYRSVRRRAARHAAAKLPKRATATL